MVGKCTGAFRQADAASRSAHPHKLERKEDNTNKRPLSVRWVIGLAAVLGLLACGAKNVLEPAQSAKDVKGMEDAIYAQDKGIRLTAQVDAWPGREEIRSEVTPVRIVLVNEGSEPVLLKYKNFDLVAQSGRVFAALPPFETRGEIVVPAEDVVATPIQPLWTTTGFELAPHYGMVYGPTMAISTVPFEYDAAYYSAYYPAWLEIPLPTAEMIQRALPEGTLRPNGKIDGFLYFEKVGDEVDQVRLKAELVAPENEQVITTLELPFDVES